MARGAGASDYVSNPTRPTGARGLKPFPVCHVADRRDPSHRERHGARFLREGGSHSVYVNRAAGTTSMSPRDREKHDDLAQHICNHETV